MTTAARDVTGTDVVNPVLAVPAAPPEAAVAHFGGRLAVEVDVADVHAALQLPDPGLLLLDTRSRTAWDAGRLPAAVHLPTADITERAPELPHDRLLVTYCWGPGCNGATRAALALARLGHPVKEMIGGYEYWVREGLGIVDRHGRRSHASDPLTAPPDASCGC